MYIRIDTVPHSSYDDGDALRVKAGDAFLALLEPLDSDARILVTQWSDAAAATAPDGATDSRTFDRSEMAVVDNPPEPAYAQLIWFTGRRSAEQATAINRANRERIWPAVRNLPGSVGALTATGADGRICTVSFGASLQALEDATAAILSTPLLPWEDPALLTGPDRIQLARVLAHQFSA